MAHPPETRQKLRTAYIGGLSLEIASAQSGVPYATARRWFTDAKATGDDWDKFRAASLIVAGGGIEQAMGRIVAAGLMRCEALLEVLGDMEDPEAQVKAVATLGDTVSKLKSAGAKLMPEADRLGVAMDVIKRLQLFIQTNYPQHGGAFAEVLLPFGDEIARAYG